MILDELANWPRFFHSEPMTRVMERLAGLGPDTAPGEYEVAGREAFIRVFEAETQPLEGALYEVHHEYADVHRLLAGEELCLWAPEGLLEPAGTFDAAKDAGFGRLIGGERNVFRLTPGRFAVFLPGEGHLTRVRAAGPGRLLRAVGKVRAGLVR